MIGSFFPLYQRTILLGYYKFSLKRKTTVENDKNDGLVEVLCFTKDSGN